MAIIAYPYQHNNAYVCQCRQNYERKIYWHNQKLCEDVGSCFHFELQTLMSTMIYNVSLPA